MIDFKIKHHFCHHTYAKEMRLDAGNSVETHKHIYDHFALLGAGRAAVEIDGNVTVHDGPSILTVKAGKMHRITAISDITWYCVHATDETDPEKVDAVLIEEQ